MMRLDDIVEQLAEIETPDECSNCTSNLLYWYLRRVKTDVQAIWACNECDKILLTVLAF